MRIRALVVDDEPLLVRGLADMLAREADVDVVGECLNGLEAVSAIRRLSPDLVFLDIQMPGLGGFQVLEELEEDLPLVVFVTAYDHYALQAFSVHAVDYLLKPVDAASFHAALERARALLRGQRPEEAARRVYDLLDHVESGRSRVSRFVVRDGSRVSFVKVDDVEAIEATGKYMLLHCGQRSHLIRETLATIEGRLDPARFMRTHRSWIVNLEGIGEIHPQGDRTAVLVLHGGRKVPVSRHYHDRLRRLTKDPLLG